MLTAQNISKTYPGGEEALRGVSFDVTGDEVVAIIGPSGAGKSTLIECINRLTEPTDGEIRLDDVTVTALSDRQLRRTRRDIAMIFQEYNLVERLTVMENVLSGRLGYLSTWNAFRRKFPAEDIEFARETLERVGLGGHERDRADELSGGQRQRVGIARAVVQRPKIMLADEPTSSLDPETSHAVMELLTEIAADERIPVLINIHEVELAVEYADRIIGLADGELVFDGPPEALDETAKDRIYRGGEPREHGTDSGRSSSADERSEDGRTVENKLAKQRYE
ncbi:phosphonate ABC transporter ATP-binding protein [Natronorubrum daqingense]|uniref:Phosphonate ABC transporter ATP-binding protein n=1 Tax=Natronorubrum daqingense TaxID=588898 RepID=A0A1N7FBK7_9EURY|nr:phosphonate ABC transporter ATP-binding protein [Natronorubrum daqingense]APX97671.1 phosphonate ABC transporter ATP-binding protein [Natronorubrum daqingense]SIR97674.1 phosphonate transport system ATP-binding protein [Natronorubrum daqingense]